jgi:hypothetical protein
VLITFKANELKGSVDDEQRITDVGIKARRMFTAGMMSHLFPQGQNWIRVVPQNRDLQRKRQRSSFVKFCNQEVCAGNRGL